MARAAHGCILAWHGCAGASHGWYGCHCFAWMGCTDHIRTDGICTHARARPEKMPMAARLGMVDKYCAPDAAADLPIVLALCVVSRNGI